MKTNFLIASGIAVTAVAAKYLYQRFFNQHTPIHKQLIIQKLIATRQVLYPILYEISYFVSQQLIPKGVPPDQAKLFIMQNQQMGFKQKILQILQQKIYNDINEQDLQYSIQNDYKNDQQIQYYKKSFQQQYQKCFLGIQPSMQTIKITIINKQTVLKFVQQLFERKLESMKLIQKQCYCVNKNINNNNNKNNNQNNNNNNNNKYDHEKLQKLIIQSENQDDQLRNNLIKQKRIGNVKNLQIAISKFIKQSKQFKIKYQNLHQNYQKRLNKIFQ